MRVLSCLTTVAWLLTLAEPCLKPPACGTEVQHRCCCGNHGECTCHVDSHRTPARPPAAGAVRASQDQLSLPAAETVSALAAQVAEATLARTFPGPSAPSPPVHLSSRALRC